MYEIEFNKLSDRWFTEGPWPEAERISPLVEDGKRGEAGEGGEGGA